MNGAAADPQLLMRRLFGLKALHYGIDLVTAALLFAGQLRPSGIFIVSDGYLLSFTGPILGGKKIVGVTPSADYVQTGLELVTAVLLIAKIARTTGVYITSNRFSIVVGSSLFGSPPSVMTIPGVPAKVLEQYENLWMKRYGIGKTSRSKR